MFIASIQYEDTISFFGKGSTPDEAFNDFSKTPFREHCENYEIKPGTTLEVYIHKAIWQDDPEWSDEFDPSWQWALGEKVDTRMLTSDALEHAPTCPETSSQDY